MSDTNKLFEEYASLLQSIKDLESKKEELSFQIIDALDEEGGKKQLSFGTFSISGRRTYDYSIKVITLKEQLKSQMKQEESDGTALLKKHTQFVRFDPVN